MRADAAASATIGSAWQCTRWVLMCAAATSAYPSPCCRHGRAALAWIRRGAGRGRGVGMRVGMPMHGAAAVICPQRPRNAPLPLTAHGQACQHVRLCGRLPLAASASCCWGPGPLACRQEPLCLPANLACLPTRAQGDGQVNDGSCGCSSLPLLRRDRHGRTDEAAGNDQG